MAYWRYRRPYWKAKRRYGFSNYARKYRARGPGAGSRYNPTTKILYLSTLIPYNSVQIQAGPIVISSRIPMYWAYKTDTNIDNLDKIGLHVISPIQQCLTNSASCFVKSCYVTIHRQPNNGDTNLVHSTQTLPYTINGVNADI